MSEQSPPLDRPVGSPITVSVVIPTYNRQRYICDALDSIFNQTRLPDEVIVVDDGSTDDTARVVAEYGDNIRYLRKANGGRSSAVNVGIRQAKSSHIWIFDDDDVALPAAIESSLKALEAHPEADFSYSYKLHYDGDGDIWESSRWRKPRVQSSNPDRLFVELMYCCFIQSQGVIMPKRCFDAIGLYDEKLLRGQDYELMLRLVRCFKGVEIGSFMYVLRNHSGARGSASDHHRSADKTLQWRQYDRVTFTRLRDELPLCEYLSLDAPSALSASDAIRALLIRADIMYHHGLYEEGSEDLSRAVAMGATAASVKALILETTNVVEWEFVSGLAHVARALTQLEGHEHGREWKSSALRGFYWTLRRMTISRHWAQAASAFYAIALLVLGGLRKKHPPVAASQSAR